VGRSTRYWIFALSLPISALAGVAAFEWVSPIGMIHRELIFGAGLGLLAIPTLLLLDLYVVKHGWCGSLCPLGAFYALVGRRSWLRIGFAADRCDHCGDCVAICPEAQILDFDAMSRAGFIYAGECLNCARCLEICPRDAFHFTLRPRRGAVQQFREGDRHATQNAA
jgi:ferredoxin-type protein NapH